MRKTLLLAVFSLLTLCFRPIWGFFGHERINGLAVFTLPPEMIGFYKKNLAYIRECSVNPDKRRYAVADEAPRHYIDLDRYHDTARAIFRTRWNEAVLLYETDSLTAHGILPWHIHTMYLRLRDAFMIKDPAEILRLSAELGHYVADANVPLHTTENYNGQLTGQDGIHAFWESRLPELFSDDYDFFLGQCEYVPDTQAAAWQAIGLAHFLVDSVLHQEKKLESGFDEKKFTFETKGKQTLKVYSPEYARAYHKALHGMVEKQMRASIRMIGSFWYTAWVDAGKPDLKKLIDYRPTEKELQENRKTLMEWKQKMYPARGHNEAEE